MKRLLPALLLASACASFGTFNSTVDGEVVFGKDAETNLKRGIDALEAKNFTDAARFFEFVKTKYPYLEAAKTAELKLADCDFERDKFTEARDRYENFVRLHPTHPEVDYAAFRAALTHYKDIPSDFFLLPPQYEKDQAEFRAAAVSLADFTRNYLESKYLKEATALLTEVRRKLADHEMYAAAFYAKRERWAAVVTRLKVVAKSYPAIGYEEQVAFGLHEAFLKLKEEDHAYEALQTFVTRYPDDPGVARARAVLSARVMAPAPAPTPPSAGAPDAGT